MAKPAHIFRNFKNSVLLRRKLLSFLHSTDDHDLIVMIASAAEDGEPLGFKQLELLGLMSSSTLQRRLRNLIERKVIKKTLVRNDGRRIAYLPTRQTSEAYIRLYEELVANGQ